MTGLTSEGFLFGVQDLRELLADFNIDVHSPANGVFLPGTGHGKMHTNDYYGMLEKKLGNIESRERMLVELNKLRKRLLRDACSGG